MDYSILAVIPTAGLIFVILVATIIKLSFRRQQNIKLRSLFAKEIFRGLKPNSETLTATYSTKRSIYMLLALSAVFIWVGWQTWTIGEYNISVFKPFYIIFGAYTLLQYSVASLVKPYRLDEHQSKEIPSMATAVIVPVYNEDKDGLKKGLQSLFTQTVLPREIHVVDDGSNVNYSNVKSWLKRTGKKVGVTTTWSRQENSGKRAAQIKAFSKVNTQEIEIIITVDSDGELDPRAIQEGVKPFIADKKVVSVAGVVIAKNAQHNMLARITDLIFVSSQQLIDRATMSAFKSVVVNSGGLALYKKDVLQNAIDNDYEEEYFMNRKVTFSDDSYLTLIALKMGKTVQQPTSLVFSDMPVQFSHHVRQQLRWGRGSFIRGWWRIRYLPVLSAGFMRQLLGWAIFTTIMSVQISLFIIIPIVYHSFPPIYLLIIPVLFIYLLSTRYFSIKRSDMSMLSQLYTYILAPVAMIWSAIILRTIRLYAMATCAKTGWGTRQAVEIVYDEDKSLETVRSTS
jgi:hyaluronan synthase